MKYPNAKIVMLRGAQGEKGEKGESGEGHYDDTQIKQMLADESLARASADAVLDSLKATRIELNQNVDMLDERIDNIMESGYVLKESSKVISTDSFTRNYYAQSGYWYDFTETFDVVIDGQTVTDYTVVEVGYTIDNGQSVSLKNTANISYKKEQNGQLTVTAKMVNQNAPSGCTTTVYVTVAVGGASVDINAEINDIRIGYDGTVYPTAGTAVRTQVSERLNLVENNKKAIVENTGIVDPYGAGVLSFVTDTDQNIIVSMSHSNYIQMLYYDGERYRYKNSRVGTFNITVPHDTCLVAIISTGELAVVDIADYYTLYDDFILCFYNQGGQVRGDWYKYVLSERIDNLDPDIPELPQIERNKKAIVENTGIVAPYNDGVFAFSTDASKNIIASMTRSNYIFMLYYNGARYIYKNCNVGQFNITVPPNSCLVGVISTGTLQVVTLNDYYTLNDDYILCFYNQNGKVRGSWEKYVIGSDVSALKNNVSNKWAEELPSYYYADNYMENKVETINTNIMNAGIGGVSFCFVTDMHWNDNAKFSPNIIRYLRRRTNVKKAILGGDFINSYTTKIQAVQAIKDILTEYYGYEHGDYYPVAGNHEYNDPSGSYASRRLSEAELYTTMSGGLVDCHTNTLAFDYYHDDDASKTRFVVLSNSYNSQPNPDSIPFLFEAVQTVPENYKVVVAMHAAVSAQKEPVPRVVTMCEGLKACKDRTAYVYDGVTYDFTSSTASIVGIFAGDIHLDMVTSSNGIPIIITLCDCWTAVQQHEESPYTRTQGAITEQAIDVVTIQPATSKIKITRIGAGSDREVSY